MSCPFLPPPAQMAIVLDKTERGHLDVPRAICKANSGEASDDLNEMDRLPLIHIVADLIREKDKVQRSHARVLPYGKALHLEMSSASRR